MRKIILPCLALCSHRGRLGAFASNWNCVACLRQRSVIKCRGLEGLKDEHQSKVGARCGSREEQGEKNVSLQPPVIRERITGVLGSWLGSREG